MLVWIADPSNQYSVKSMLNLVESCRAGASVPIKAIWMIMAAPPETMFLLVSLSTENQVQGVLFKKRDHWQPGSMVLRFGEVLPLLEGFGLSASNGGV